MEIILSTGNSSKAKQIGAVFAGMVAVTVLTLAEAGIEGEAVEDGDTLRDNALKKALFAKLHGPTNAWAMADDTGLFIRALNGAPGVRAARWAGDTATTDEITAHTLKMLEGARDRSATFETVVALISPSGEEYFFTGRCRGCLLEESRTKPQPKMPYSPIFVPDGHSRVWAEMTVEEENAISHRGEAFRQVREFFEKLI